MDRCTVLPLVLLAFATALVCASTAAADYSVWSCRGPDGAPVSASLWAAGGNAGRRAAATATDTCPTGGSLTAQLPGSDYDGGTVTGFRAAVPAGATINGADVYLTAATAVASGASRFAAGVGYGNALTTGDSALGCRGVSSDACSLGNDADPLAAGNLEIIDSPTTALTLYARCVTNTGCVAEAGPAAVTHLYRSRLSVADATPPSVGSLSGSLLRSGPRSGVESVRAPTADAQGGILRRALLIDGTAVSTASGSGTCVEPFTIIEPCPKDAPAAFDVDTTTLTDGPHTVAVRAIDAAGQTTDGSVTAFTVLNTVPAATATVTETPTATVTETPTATVTETTTVTATQTPTATASPAPTATATAAPAQTPASVPTTGPFGTPAPLVVVPAPAPSPTTVAVRRLHIELPERRELPARRPVTGQLLDAADQPVAGAFIALSRKPIGAPDRAYRAYDGAFTDADGSFPVGDGGPSRSVRATLLSDTAVAAPADIALVRNLTVSISGPERPVRNDDSFTLTGDLDGAGGAAEDRLVEVQALIRNRWRVVDTVRTRASGAVSWTYRLERTTVASDFRFRFVVPTIRESPFDRTVSDVFVVKVRPR